MAKDNSTLRAKVALRLWGMDQIKEPCILEPYAGAGRVGYRCDYAEHPGLAIEQRMDRAAVVAQSRPQWEVYRGDAVRLAAAGLGRHRVFNLVDVDPWGDPWPFLLAYFHSERPQPERCVLIVHDGLRQKLKRGGGFAVASLQKMRCIQRVGNDALYKSYPSLLPDMLAEVADGFMVADWRKAGGGELNINYAAVLTKIGESR